MHILVGLVDIKLLQHVEAMQIMIFYLLLAFVSGAHAIPVSRTLAIVRPEALYKDALIMADFLSSGFRVKERSVVSLDKSTAKQFLDSKIANQPNEDLIEAWSEKPMIVYLLERRSAVAMAKAIAGPEDPATAKTAAPYSVRAKHGDTAIHNALYCARTLAEATQDISHFFPLEQGNTGLDKEHRLMPFDVSALGPDVSLSSMTWLEQHEREATSDGHGELDILNIGNMYAEPSLGLRLLSDEYVEALPDSAREAVEKRLGALEEVLDAGNQQASCAGATVDAGKESFLNTMSQHMEL
eukprot:jgi/Ulvmu1/7168/UM034_0076.1